MIIDATRRADVVVAGALVANPPTELVAPVRVVVTVGGGSRGTEVQAVTRILRRGVRDAVAKRLDACGGLQLHPGKTRVVYCKDGKRRGSYQHTSFVFLGYGFGVRKARTKREDYFFSFNPAISDEAAKRIGAQIRAWRLHLRSGASLKDLAREVNAVVRGWINY